MRVIIKNFGILKCGKPNPVQPRAIVEMIRRFIHSSIRWGWTCNSDWQGIGKSFNVSIPAQEHLVIQGMKYNPNQRQIEVWGYYSEDKYVDTKYNGRPIYVPSDQCRPESEERNG